MKWYEPFWKSLWQYLTINEYKMTHFCFGQKESQSMPIFSVLNIEIMSYLEMQ